MRINYYDVTLRRMTAGDKELVRYWRNHEKIRSKMEFREYITPEMHDKWFERMSDYKNDAYAFIIEYQEASSGVIYYTKAEDHSEGGMFIWDDKCLNTQVPVVVSIMLTDINFYFSGNKEAYVRILRDNYNAIQFNKLIGYRLVDEHDPSYNQRYYLTEEAYRKNVGKIKDVLKSYYGYESKIRVIMEQQDADEGLIEFYRARYEKEWISGKHIEVKLSYLGRL